MSFTVINSRTKLDEMMCKPYLIVFFPKASVSKYLDFRQDSSPLCWDLISKNYTSSATLSRDWVTHLQQTRGVTVSHGVAFFKKGVLKMELEGFDKEKFDKMLKEFDPLGTNPPPAVNNGCCNCVIL